MVKTCKLCWGLSALSITVVAVMAYMFVIRGNVSESDDGRTAITLSAGERDLVLAEMRDFLESVQSIVAGLAENDMAAVAASAKVVGMANFQGVPTTLMAKLPLDFKALGRSTHQAFDALAMEALDMGDQKVVLARLGKVMLNCTSCHAGYRLDIEGADRKVE